MANRSGLSREWPIDETGRKICIEKPIRYKSDTVKPGAEYLLENSVFLDVIQ